MSDNNLDNFFKSSLEDYEANPQKQTWENIHLQLKNINKNGKYWMAAASVVFILLSVIIFSNTNIKVIKLRADIQKDISNTKVALITTASKKEINYPKELTLEELKEENEKRFLALIANSAVSTNNNIKQEEKTKTIAFREIDLSGAAANQEINPENKNQNFTTKEVISNVDKQADEPLFVKETPEKDEVSIIGKKTKIRSIRDLVNFIVAKVDNREEKVLYVSKTEESDMEITSINLGLLKYRKH